MDEDGLISVGEGNVGSRKKEKVLGKRERKKNEKYKAPSGCNLFTPCHHNKKRFKCHLIRPADARKVRNALYTIPDKYHQDALISSFISLSNIKRKMPNQHKTSGSDSTGKPKPHTFNVNYNIFSVNGKVVPICKKFFLQLTKVKPTRLHNIAKKVMNNEGLSEQRGGDRISHKSEKKKAAVRHFLRNLKGRESHYNRKKSKRIYLSSDLNISKLHKM